MESGPYSEFQRNESREEPGGWKCVIWRVFGLYPKQVSVSEISFYAQLIFNSDLTDFCT